MRPFASITGRLDGLGADKWDLHLEARRRREAGEDIIMLTIGEPDVPTPPDLVEQAHAAMKKGRTRYSYGRGEPVLIEALARKYSARTGRTIDAGNILCLPGTQTALFNVMTGLVESGDSVLIPDPLYATYEGVVRSTGADIVTVPLSAANGFHLTPEALEAAVNPSCKVLMLNSPHNPTGAVLDADEIAAVGKVCEKHDLWIVSDEVYEELIFEKTFASPLDNPSLAERTVAVSSISKSHAAPGFRSGWCVGPQAFCDALQPVSETMLFGSQPFIADMTAYALSQPPVAAEAMRGNYLRRAGIVRDALAGSNALKPMMPEAGMFMLIDVSATGMSGNAFAWRLLEEERVAVMPGDSFGEQARDFIRLSLTVPDDSLRESAKRMKSLAQMSAIS